MTAQVHRDNLIRPRCGSNRIPKDGHSRGNQTCRCREFRVSLPFRPRRQPSLLPRISQNPGRRNVYEGMGVLEISRTLDVKPGTIYSWLAKSRPDPDGVADAPAPASAAATSAGKSP